MTGPARTGEPAQGVAQVSPGHPKPRLIQLDVLRAAAVLLVFGRHVPPDSSGGAVAATIERVGWIGVDLFFVLSGYLVSGLLFSQHRRTNAVHVRRFLVRRGYKIYPAFYALLAGSVVFAVISLRAPHPWRAWLGELIFLQNYLGGIWPHTWSLAVEEHFYFLLVVSVLFARRVSSDPIRCLKFLPIAFAAVAVACLTARCVQSYRLPYSFETHATPTHLRIDSLLFGVLLSYWSSTHGDQLDAALRRFRSPILFAAIGLIFPAIVLDLEHPFVHTVGFSMLYLGFGGLLMLSVSSTGWDGYRPCRALASLGYYSYSIYLWHLPVFSIGERMLRGSPYPVRLVALSSAAVLIGVVIARLVEMPVLAIRDRLVPDTPPGRTVVNAQVAPDFAPSIGSATQTSSC